MKRNTQNSLGNCCETMLLLVRTCCLKYFELFLRCYDTNSVMCIFVYAQRSAHSVRCTCDYTCVVDRFNWYIMQIVMVWIARLHSQRRTHISNAQVIKSKNEQNCSLIHMMKYNPLDGNCICFDLTFFRTHMHANACCLNRISRMPFSFLVSVVVTVSCICVQCA